MDNGTSISDTEILYLPIGNPADQMILRLLKERGAPIIGSTFLLSDPTYEITSWYIPYTKTTHFKWIKA